MDALARKKARRERERRRGRRHTYLMDGIDSLSSSEQLVKQLVQTLQLVKRPSERGIRLLVLVVLVGGRVLIGWRRGRGRDEVVDGQVGKVGLDRLVEQVGGGRLTARRPRQERRVHSCAGLEKSIGVNGWRVGRTTDATETSSNQAL